MSPKKAVAPTRRRNYGRNHGYFVDGEKVPGVTTIIGNGMPKPGLISWAARVTAETAIHRREVWSEMTESEALKYLTDARNQRSTEAAARGTQIHGWAEKLARGEEVEVPDAERDHVDAFLDWWNEWDAEIVASELVVVNRRWGYCGSVDLVADLKGWNEDGSAARVLVDLSTSGSGVYPEKALQVCAYANAENYLPVPDGSEGELPLADLGIEFGAIVWLQPSGAETYPVEIGEAAFRDFLYVKQVAEIMGADRDSGRGRTYLGESAAPYPFERKVDDR